METFSASLALCGGNSPVIGEFPSQRPVTRSFDVFFDLRLNKRLSKQSWDWWFETPSGSLWRHCNEENCQKKSSHPMRGIRPSVGQSETALLEILKSYWAHCHAKVRFSLFPYGICGVFLNQDKAKMHIANTKPNHCQHVIGWGLSFDGCEQKEQGKRD